MRAILFILLLAAASWASMVKPVQFDTHDTGSESLPTLDVDMTIDCDSKDLFVSVSHGEDPIEGASAVLFYTDYSYQPLPGGGNTDSAGSVTLSVPGTIDFLTALFILRVDKSGYRSREIEFAYEKCFEEPPAEPPPEPELYENESGAETNPEPPGNENPPANVTPPEEVKPPSNVSPQMNDTTPEENPPETTETGGACPVGIVLISLLCARVMR